MIVKYSVSGENISVREISEMYREADTKNVYFVPENPLLDIVCVKNVNDFDYQQMVKTLYENEKLNLVAFEKNTYYVSFGNDDEE